MGRSALHRPHRDIREGLQLRRVCTDELTQSAVERQFEIIGEALKRADEYFPGSVDGLPNVKQAMRFRDRIAHGYFNLDADVIWKAIGDDLPSLREAVRALMPPLPL
jgi:uncharacterized protein with HEPN domain